jgi:hypothetical protein
MTIDARLRRYLTPEMIAALEKVPQPVGVIVAGKIDGNGKVQRNVLVVIIGKSISWGWPMTPEHTVWRAP